MSIDQNLSVLEKSKIISDFRSMWDDVVIPEVRRNLSEIAFDINQIAPVAIEFAADSPVFENALSAIYGIDQLHFIFDVEKCENGIHTYGLTSRPVETSPNTIILSIRAQTIDVAIMMTYRFACDMERYLLEHERFPDRVNGFPNHTHLGEKYTGYLTKIATPYFEEAEETARQCIVDRCLDLPVRIPPVGPFGTNGKLFVSKRVSWDSWCTTMVSLKHEYRMDLVVITDPEDISSKTCAHICCKVKNPADSPTPKYGILMKVSAQLLHDLYGLRAVSYEEVGETLEAIGIPQFS